MSVWEIPIVFQRRIGGNQALFTKKRTEAEKALTSWGKGVTM